MLEIAAIVGSRKSRSVDQICTGSVLTSGLVRKIATTTSSSEVAKANSAPATTPGRISGNVTRRKTANGPAPRFAAARSTSASTVSRLALTVATTNGIASAACASTSPVCVPVSRKSL